MSIIQPIVQPIVRPIVRGIIPGTEEPDTGPAGDLLLETGDNIILEDGSGNVLLEGD